MASPGINIKVLSLEELEQLSWGNKFEIEVLGHGWKFVTPPEYVPWQDAKSEVQSRDLPGYDPSHPSGGLTEELYEGVRAYLPKRRKPFLRLYLAIASRLDFFHGVDAFFFLDEVIVTIDVTTDSTKEKKADFLLTPEDLTYDDEGKPRGFHKKFLRQIATLLKERRMMRRRRT